MHAAPAAPPTQDELLTEGFFRAGHTYARTRFLFVAQRTYSAVWSRVPVATFSFRRSHRRLLTRTRRRFREEIAPYTPTPEQDAVYAAYQAEHPLDVAESVAEVFGRHEPHFEFDTHVLRVYDGDRLVAFSCFDLGATTLASLFGCYLPEYARHSLGIFTMLAELEYARGRGLVHYHPGYCVPGLPAFAYKQRLPDLEGRTYRDAAWRPMAEALSPPLPHEEIRLRCAELSALLTAHAVEHSTEVTPLSELLPFGNAAYGSFPFPLLVRLAWAIEGGEVYIGWEAAQQRYEVWYGQPVADLRNEGDFPDLRERVPEDANLLLFAHRVGLFASGDAALLAAFLSPERLRERLLELYPPWVLAETERDLRVRQA